jgi:hypothetical protein
VEEQLIARGESIGEHYIPILIDDLRVREVVERAVDRSGASDRQRIRARKVERPIDNLSLQEQEIGNVELRCHDVLSALI